MSMNSSKILDFNVLEQISIVATQSGKRLVLCHGTFDLMHAGHIKHLQGAKTKGDILIVTVTADSYVNKGPGRPVFNENLRAESIASLQCVDYVSVINEPTALNPINKIRPHTYVKGNDYKEMSKDMTGNIVKEKCAVEKYGGSIIFTDEITFSSSSLLNEYFDVLSGDSKKYLAAIKKEYSSDEIIKFLQNLRGLNVVVIGDAIVDEYHYTEPLGQTGKGNLLAVKYLSEERFAGGAIAVANHVAGFCSDVTLVTGLGGKESFKGFIDSKLKKNISPIYFYNDDATTLVKRRFVDMDMDKLFEVYFHNKESFPPSIQRKVVEWLDENLKKFDMVIVPDFGNGFISHEIVDVLSKKSGFLAVNTQVNSGNRGYHAITRYPRANFISLNEPELRLATHSRFGDLHELASNIAIKLGASSIAITRGTKGAMFVDVEKEICVDIPALSSSIVDRVGAGDAFLAMAGLCEKAGLPVNVSGFVASIAAAISVQSVCNRNPIEPIKLYKYIATLMK